MKDLTVLDNLIIGRVEPSVYAFTTNTIPDYLKVGDTYRPVSVRLKEWTVHFPNLKKQYENTAKVSDESYFRDYSVHQYLESDLHKQRLLPEQLNKGIYYSNEFFEGAEKGDVAAAVKDILNDFQTSGGKYQFYDAVTSLPQKKTYPSAGEWKPRPNQQATIEAFKKAVAAGRTKLLMYAVMRFGKSFTSMCCAKEIGAKFVVVVSAKADVKDEWRKTVESADNFRNEYEFLSSHDLEKNYNIVKTKLDKNEKKAVLFLTLQDLQGNIIKDKHRQVFGRKIDLLIVDETHFGARAENYGKVLGKKPDKRDYDDDDYIEYSEAAKQLKILDAEIKLHLSGTPYRILMGGEFQKEDIIAFYQFTDIVNEQRLWDSAHAAEIDTGTLNEQTGKPYQEWDNPYFGFPQMIRFAFNPNESSRRRLKELRESGKTSAFSALFMPRSIESNKDGFHKQFVYENEVLELFEVIDGSKEEENLLGFLDYEKIRKGKMCRHIVCVLPYRASCDALEALIKKYAGKFRNLGQYEIINISGVDKPDLYETPQTIKAKIKRCEEEGKKTITLTVNRMLTGSTVEEWDTMLFLKDSESSQEYDQAIFRLQNQYVKSYKSKNGDTIKYNMKPQTLLVDFCPDRMFRMQEQKSQIYNVNVDEAGNSKLSDRIETELNVSPIIVMNKDKIEQVEASDIMKAVSEYSQSRGVMDETEDIPVDISLMNIAAVWNVIKRENELKSKDGFKIKAAAGEGTELDIPESTADADGASADKTDTADTNDAVKSEKDKNAKDPVKQFRMYYARILYFAFLTKDTVFSLEGILKVSNSDDNSRIFANLGLSKNVLKLLQDNMDKFMLRALDYKIQNISNLSHDESIAPLKRASVANQKFGKIGESEVVTPVFITNDMVALLPDDFLRDCVINDCKILDIASKEGEFAIALFKRFEKLGFGAEDIKDIIYSIPTSAITYEFTRKVYEILGLNTENIAVNFTSYDLLNIKKGSSKIIDYAKVKALLSQAKPFSKIKLTDEIEAGGAEKVKFDAVVGNPPYQESAENTSDKPVYNLFMDVAFKISNKVSFITPARFLFNAGKTSKEWNDKMLSDRHFKVVLYKANSSDVFPNVDIKGGVAVTFRDVNQDFGEIGIYSAFDELNQILNKVITKAKSSLADLIYAPESYKFTDIIHSENDWAIKRLSQGHSKDITSNIFEKLPELFLDEKKSNEYVGIYGRLRNDRVTKFIKRKYIEPHENLDKYKVFVPKSNGSGALGEVLSTPEIGQPEIGHTQTFISIGAFNTEFEATALLQYIKSKFARCMLGILKVTQDNKKSVWKYVPLQDFTPDSDIDWSKSIPEIDRQLYAKYNLSDDEIAFIEKMIKPME